jgi:hypothetical protein
MKNINWIFILAFFLTGCPPAKKQEPVPGGAKTDSSVTGTASSTKVETANADSLDYEAVGASTLKTESLARSKAELKARESIVSLLSADACRMMEGFSSAQPDLFVGRLDKPKYAKQITEAFLKSTMLRNSRVSEYSKSDKGDTTFASIEMPLMDGYAEIERVLVDVGTKSKFLNSDADKFKKAFKEFFMAEKKRQLTKPS